MKSVTFEEKSLSYIHIIFANYIERVATIRSFINLGREVHL